MKRSGIILKAKNLAASLFAALFHSSYREHRIAFSDRVFMRVSDEKVVLVAISIDNIQSMKITVQQAKQVIRSIARACDLKGVEEINTGDLSWKTDARVQKSAPDKVYIQFNGPSGLVRAVSSRDDVISAVDEFTKKFNSTEHYFA